MEKNISISKHAIKRYRQRLFNYRSTDEEIKQLLNEIVRKGKRTFLRPSSFGTCIEVEYKGLSIVLLTDKDHSVVITCLGDKTYRKWVKTKETLKLRGRILHFDSCLQ